jgi:hypothetical protein
VDILIYATGFQWMGAGSFNMIVGRVRLEENGGMPTADHACAKAMKPPLMGTIIGLHVCWGNYEGPTIATSNYRR